MGNNSDFADACRAATAASWGTAWRCAFWITIGVNVAFDALLAFSAWRNWITVESMKENALIALLSLMAVSAAYGTWWLLNFIPKRRLLSEARALTDEGTAFIQEGLRLRRAMLVVLFRKDEKALADLQPRLNAWNAWLNELKDKRTFEVGWHVPMAEVPFKHDWAVAHWVEWLDHGSTRAALAIEVISDVAHGTQSPVTEYALTSYRDYFKRKYALPLRLHAALPARAGDRSDSALSRAT